MKAELNLTRTMGGNDGDISIVPENDTEAYALDMVLPHLQNGGKLIIRNGNCPAFKLVPMPDINREQDRRRKQEK